MATPVPLPPRPCEASAFEIPRASAASCTPSRAPAVETGDEDDDQAREREQECPHSPHHRNVMVMV